MKQILSHYQSVLPNKFGNSNSDKIFDIEEMLYILLDHNLELTKTLGFLIVAKEESDEDDGFSDEIFEGEDISSTWGTVILSKEPHLFPTSQETRWGATISYMGKEYHLWYDEDDLLNIGYNRINRVFNNPSIVEDCLETHAMIFEGIVFNEPISV